MTSPRHAARSATRLPLGLLAITSVVAALSPAVGGLLVVAGVAVAILGGVACAALLVRRHRREVLEERQIARVGQQRLVGELLETHARQRQVLDQVSLRSAEQRREVETDRDKLREELGWVRAQVAMRTKDAALAHGVIAEQRAELGRLQAELTTALTELANARTELADARTELAIEREVTAEINRGEITVAAGRRAAV